MDVYRGFETRRYTDTETWPMLAVDTFEAVRGQLCVSVTATGAGEGGSMAEALREEIDRLLDPQSLN